MIDEVIQKKANKVLKILDDGWSLPPKSTLKTLARLYKTDYGFLKQSWVDGKVNRLKDKLRA